MSTNKTTAAANAGVMLNQASGGLRDVIRAKLEYIVANHRPAPGLPPCEFFADAVDVAMADNEHLIAALILRLGDSLEKREKHCAGRDIAA